LSANSPTTVTVGGTASSWSTLLQTTGNTWTPSTGIYQIVALYSGTYVVTFQATFTENGQNIQNPQMSILVDGSVVAFSRPLAWPNLNVSTQTTMLVNWAGELQSADTVQCQVTNLSGTVLNADVSVQLSAIKVFGIV